MEATFLKPNDLAKRWGVSMATLSQWRWNGKGPLYLKMGRHISYDIHDVEQFEKSKRRRSTSDTPPNDDHLELSHQGCNTKESYPKKSYSKQFNLSGRRK